MLNIKKNDIRFNYFKNCFPIQKYRSFTFWIFDFTYKNYNHIAYAKAIAAIADPIIFLASHSTVTTSAPTEVVFPLNDFGIQERIKYPATSYSPQHLVSPPIGRHPSSGHAFSVAFEAILASSSEINSKSSSFSPAAADGSSSS